MRLPRWLKLAAATLAGLVVLVVAGLAVLVNTLDLGRYAKLAADEVRAATGRELTIAGPVGLRLFPSPAVVAQDVSFANAPWGSRREMAKVKRIEGGVALLPLLRKEIEVTRLVLVEPDVLLETDARGVGNWVFKTAAAPARPPAAEAAPAPPIEVSHVAIDDGTLVWRDGRRKASVRLTVPKLRLARRTLGGELAVDLAATFRDQPFTLKGSIGTLRRLLAKDAAWPLDLAFATEGATLAVDGQLDLRTPVPLFDGAVKGEVKDAAGIGRLAGGPLAVPVPLSLDAKATAADGKFTVSPLKAAIGKSTIDGRITVQAAGPRPYVNAAIKSPLVDLAAAAPARPAAKAGGGARDGRVFSDAPFPLELLRAFDADAEVAIGRLVTGNRLAVDDLKVRVALKGGRLDVQPFSASIGGGAVGGRLALDASRPQAASLAMSVEGRNIDLQQVAAAAGHGGTVRGGRLELAVSLAGPGESVRRFAAGANGEVRVVVNGPVQLSGAALDFGGDALTKVADAVNPLRRSDQGTELRCAVARLPVRDGIVSVQRTIAAETNRIDAVAAGTINLRNEALDLAIKPHLKEGLGLGAASLAELVRVGGTLANPSVGLDTLASAKAALSVGGALMTGGLSLLGQSLLSRSSADPQPCRTALAGGAAPRAAAEPAPAKPQDEGGVMGSLRRLFR